jgi:hypothetical protein
MENILAPSDVLTSKKPKVKKAVAGKIKKPSIPKIKKPKKR